MTFRFAESSDVRVDVLEENVASLAAYASVPIAFEVAEVLDLRGEQSTVGVQLRAGKVTVPYVKDYDAIDGGPTSWPQRFDLSNWALFAALAGGVRVGGAAVTFNSADVALMEGRADLAVLWDIRVAPRQRGRGVGAALLATAEAWAAARGCPELIVETQDVNVPACRFYARHGFTLVAINLAAYATLPDEVQLLWSKRLGP